MELDGTTFVLEIINFLVLIWLLSRFLFRPVRAALQAKSDQEAQQQQALAAQRAQLQADGEALTQQLAKMAEQRDLAEAQLAQEMATLRRQQMQALETELLAERTKAQAMAEQERLRQQASHDQALHQRAAAFVTNYMQRLATPALEQSIIQLFEQDLVQQPDTSKQTLLDGLAHGQQGEVVITVSTAFEPSDGQRQGVATQLNAFIGHACTLVWQQDPALLAGICVHLPGHELEASLRRGISAFAAGTPGAPT